MPGLVSISFSNETGRGGTPRLQVLLHASSQSAFHFSIALLFRYRSCVKVFGLGRNTPPSASVCIHKQVYSLGRKRPKRVSPHEEKGATIKFAYLSCSSNPQQIPFGASLSTSAEQEDSRSTSQNKTRGNHPSETSIFV